MKSGDKVGIKINLTGGSPGASANNMWTDPEVLRAVEELILDCGVNANVLYTVEALWNGQAYATYDYADEQNSLGAKLVDLNQKAAYADFVCRNAGTNGLQYTAFDTNGILSDINVYMSIPRLRQHYEESCLRKIEGTVLPSADFSAGVALVKEWGVGPLS